MLLQPHVEAATVYGLRRQSLLVFLPKYHLKVRTHCCCVARLCLLLVFRLTARVELTAVEHIVLLWKTQ